MSPGPFAAAALELHGRGLVVIPTGGSDGKKPLVEGWGRWRGQAARTVESFAERYPAANVAVITGLSRLTVIDADDENTLADAEGRFGRSPIVARSPRGGGHLYYRSSGERNANLRPAMNVDIRGIGGIVLAPPSVRAGIGVYFLERGTWDDLAELPALAPDAIPPRAARAAQATNAEKKAANGAGEGARNDSLFAELRYYVVASACVSLPDLITEAHTINAQFQPPLPSAEAEKVAASVWRMKTEDRIILPGQQRILMLPGELEGLGADAFYFAAWIKRWHGAKAGGAFALSPKAMERSRVLPSWGRRRYENAIRCLLGAGFLVRLHKGGSKKGDVAQFAMGARNSPNVTRHPSALSPQGLRE